MIVPRPMGSSERRHSSISGSQRGWLRTWSSANNVKTAATGRSISCETSILTVDRALEQTFSRYAIDPVRLAIGGFSDEASYALYLGIANGDLFTHVLAFSPGLMAPAGRTGSPRIFVSHGVRDGVLPIDRCSRRIVPELKRGGYDVLYREFDGEHSISLEIALEAIGWFTQEKFP
jgi:predicted esterase